DVHEIHRLRIEEDFDINPIDRPLGTRLELHHYDVVRKTLRARRSDLDAAVDVPSRLVEGEWGKALVDSVHDGGVDVDRDRGEQRIGAELLDDGVHDEPRSRAPAGLLALTA